MSKSSRTDARRDVFSEDYTRTNTLPTFAEAVRRVTRRYGMTGRIDQDEMCDLCATHAEIEYVTIRQ